MKIDGLYKLKKKDIDKTADVLAKAFSNYPLFKFILGYNHNIENIKFLTKFVDKFTILYVQSYANSLDIEGFI